MVIGIAGVDDRTGRPFFDLEPTVGGWGALGKTGASLSGLPDVLQSFSADNGYFPSGVGFTRWRARTSPSLRIASGIHPPVNPTR